MSLRLRDYAAWSEKAEEGTNPLNIRIGALEATEPAKTLGNLILNQAESIPEYELPNAITGASIRSVLLFL